MGAAWRSHKDRDTYTLCAMVQGVSELGLETCMTLGTLPAHPDSVPVNLWNEIEGVPVQETARPVDAFALVRLVALPRILMPASVVRLSAGRTGMSDKLQTPCFLAGANSIFVGDQLRTTGNPEAWKEHDLLQRLGMHVAPARPQGSAMAAG
jgi:biotin synthase